MNRTLVTGLMLVIVIIAVILLNQSEEEVSQAIEVDRSTAVTTRSGDLVGFIDSYNSRAWLGIPFAEPPLDDLRWKATVPVRSWQGERSALKASDPCPQIGNVLSGAATDAYGKPDGAEDCLYLNIWSPGTSENEAGSLPVMFWIHGGGNSIGYGGSPSYNGAHLASRHNLIVVSINYRLGPFGWFAHPALNRTDGSAEDRSGNYGTLDIIAALQWVQANISVFGGDPRNVTLFGESAGGVDVLTMMASPLAAGLYQKAIVQSGGLFMSPMTDASNYLDDPEPGDKYSAREVVNLLLIADGKAVDRLAAKTLQDGMSDDAVSAYLRSKTIEEILGVYNQGAGSMLQMPLVFADGVVLPASMKATEIFANEANYNVTPVMLGTNRDEVKLFMMMGGDAINSIFGIPWSFKDEVAYERDSRYGSDAWKVRGVDDIASALAQAQSLPVFAYRFDWDEEKSIFGFEMSKALGAAHGFEIAFVFGNFASSFGLDLYEEAGIPARDRLSATMMSYWAQFAYTGQPGRGRDGNQPEWTPWLNGDEKTERLMILDTDRDQGVRMSSERYTAELIKQRFMADNSFATPEEKCSSYTMVFRGDAFNQAEYEGLGCD